MTEPMNIVTLCTGNVARSVMLGYMLTTLADVTDQEWRVRTAGTHVTEGSAMSGRTRDALMKLEGIGDHRYGAHRSHQLSTSDCEWADVILAAEVDNVNFVRKNFPPHTERAVQLASFVRFAPLDGDIDEKLRVVTQHEPSAELNVTDPAGGDQATYDACALQLWNLAEEFALIVKDRRVD
jgi:protein-tyrosine-phosphatase